MNISPKKFHESINKELEVIQDRVRNLIGGANWGEDGRYKEAILRTILRKFLPDNLSLGTGFILRKTDDEIKISTQIDIIVYDNTYPVLFREGDFLITTPANVKAIIEVKTGIDSTEVRGVISKASANSNLVGSTIFNGIFVYDSNSLVNNDIVHPNLKAALEASKGTVNHLSFGEAVFIKFWPRETINENPSDMYSVYDIPGLSFSFFISNLIELVSKDSLLERGWFLYPIGKEQHKLTDIVIPLPPINQNT